MEGKGLVKFFLVALLLVVIYQFLLVLPARTVEKNASNFATETTGSYAPDNIKWKDAEIDYLDSISNEKVLNLGVKSYTYEELKKNQMGLGLDLKGGMSVVMQVDLVDLVKEMSGKSQDKNFQAAVKLAKENLANAQTDYITLFADAYKKTAPGQSLANIFATNPDYRDVINMESTDQEVITEIRKQADETVVRTYEKVKRRIDQFGTMQPNITLDQSVNRIMVELPGITNPERARKILQSTAKLEFYPVFQFSEIQDQLSVANNTLKATMGGADYVQDIDSTLMTFDSLGVRNDEFYIANKEKLDKQAETNFGEGPLFSLLTPNGGNQALAVAGTANWRDTSAINKLLARKEVSNVMRKNAVFRWKSKPIRDRDTREYTDDFELYTINTTKRKGAMLEGDKITDANENIDSQSGGGGGAYIVNLKMNKEGAKIWRKMTSENLKREVAILLDDQVVSAPTVQSEIKDGNSQISGDFSVREAQDLANVLKVGKLPARTEIIQEAIVGPSLGQDNINRSLKALVVGILMVLAFMVLYYSTGGIISIIALIANIFFILGTLSSQAMVMTLPGIAGIVLTIGMAVDANVIIFERIREELRDGKSTLAAIRDGFSASYSAIIDANVTTILTAIVLYVFGAGPIVGFAIVLIFGVMFSLFSAVLLTRLMIDWLSDRGTEVKFSTGFSKSAFANSNIDFIGKSKMALMGSGIFILLGIGSILTQGFDLGVDFTGGRSYTIKLDESINFDKLRNDLTPVFGNETPLVKQFDASNQAEITTSYRIDESGENVDSEVLAALLGGVNTYAGKNYTMDQFSKGTSAQPRVLQRSIKIGPTIADDIRSSAFYATIFALLGIFLYILLRFRKWQYGVGAVAALFHDVLVVLGIFSLLWKFLPFSIEIDQAFIAAILTVVGYSINDTVVVFDRIREFFNSYTKKGKEEVINLAVNNTISRTIITSLTTFFVVLMLFVFGGGSIKGFAFALLIGILVGTYSSVFIATPIVNLLTSEADIKTPSTSKNKQGKGYSRKVVTEK